MKSLKNIKIFIKTKLAEKKRGENEKQKYMRVKVCGTFVFLFRNKFISSKAKSLQKKYKSERRNT